MGAPAPIETLALLREGLDETADALTHADLTRLLASETRLQAALASLARNCTVTRGDAAARAELQRIQRSVLACRRLGAALTDFIEMSGSHMQTDPVTHTFRHSA